MNKRSIDDVSLNDDSTNENLDNKKYKEEISKYENKHRRVMKFLIERKYNTRILVDTLHKNIDYLRKEDRIISDYLYNMCDHEWEVDDSYFEPCGPTPRICNKCDSQR